MSVIFASIAQRSLAHVKLALKPAEPLDLFGSSFRHGPGSLAPAAESRTARSIEATLICRLQLRTRAGFQRSNGKCCKAKAVGSARVRKGLRPRPGPSSRCCAKSTAGGRLRVLCNLQVLSGLAYRVLDGLGCESPECMAGMQGQSAMSKGFRSGYFGVGFTRGL